MVAVGPVPDLGFVLQAVGVGALVGTALVLFQPRMRRTRRYGGSVSYQVKPRSHVVSAGYLRAWTHGGEIALRLGASEESVTTSVRFGATSTDASD
jgi:hypothetical protein